MTHEEIKALRVGDGIVWKNFRKREIVVRHCADGSVMTDYGHVPLHLAPDMRRETFWEFISRPTGFGHTYWAAAILIHLFGAASIVAAFDYGPWALLGLIAPVTLWVGTWMNYTGRWN